MRTIYSLADLLPGEAAEISELTAKGAKRSRLQDIGLTPGTRVECVYPSPLGDPVAYNVRGTTIALRCEDAAEIIIHNRVDIR